MWSTNSTFVEIQIFNYPDSSALDVLTCSEAVGFQFCGEIWLENRRFCSNSWNPKTSRSANVLRKGIDLTSSQFSNFDLSFRVFSAVTLLVGRVLLVNENKNWNLSIFSNVDLKVQKMQKLLLVLTFLSTIKLFFNVLAVMLWFFSSLLTCNASLILFGLDWRSKYLRWSLNFLFVESLSHQLSSFRSSREKTVNNLFAYVWFLTFPSREMLSTILIYFVFQVNVFSETTTSFLLSLSVSAALYMWRAMRKKLSCFSSPGIV